VRKLPDELFHTRPVLSVGYAWALLDGGELEASEALLQNAEVCLQQPMEEIIVVDKEQFRSLPASIATARAYRSLALGNVSDTVKYARQGLELTPVDDQTRTMQAVSLLGLAQYTNGDLDAAEHALADFHAHLRNTGEILTLIGITFLLADIRVALGRLHKAQSIYQLTLRQSTSQNKLIPLGTADLYRGLSELCVERDDLEAAAQYMLTIQKMGDQSMLTDWHYRLCVSQARLKEAQGDLDGALALLDQAERVHIRGPLPDVRPIAALKARVWLKQDRLADAQGWVNEQGFSVDDELYFVHEFEHVTLARVLIATGQIDPGNGALDEASRLLERLLQAAETGGRLGSVIQILLLQALVFQAQDYHPHAIQSLERALVLAEPQGYVRIFVDEGQSMRLLLEKQSNRRDHALNGYVNSLLTAFAKPAASQSVIHHQKSDLIEPLSERELEVLRLLRSELSGPEIAQQLIVSLNTLRTHTKNIFNKLGVNNRRMAVRRAEELDLF
jgi:LuxR family maltose regulon positive regulatory protein